MDSKDVSELDRVAQRDMMAALGMLAAGLAHEINTPLGAVRCTGSTLNRIHDKLCELVAAEAPGLGGNPEFVRLKEMLAESDRILQVSAERILMLVKQMRKFMAHDCPDPVDYDLAETIDGLLLVLNHELKQRITVVRDYGDLPRLYGFPDPVGQILLNLLLNAAQAMPGEGTLTIAARLDGERVVVDVSDDGPGVPEEIRETIFELGFTTKEDAGGTGFGLALARHLAAKMDGTLEFSTPPGGGSRFTLCFPRRLERRPDGSGPCAPDIDAGA